MQAPCGCTTPERCTCALCWTTLGQWAGSEVSHPHLHSQVNASSWLCCAESMSMMSFLDRCIAVLMQTASQKCWAVHAALHCTALCATSLLDWCQCRHDTSYNGNQRCQHSTVVPKIKPQGVKHGTSFLEHVDVLV